MTTLLNAILQFVLHVNDPSWKCEVAHRDPGVAGTYYLYCSQWTFDGVELIDVGRFIPDVPRAHKGRP